MKTDFPRRLILDRLIDLLEGTLRDEFVKGEATVHVQVNQAWNESVRHAIAMDDAANGDTVAHNRGRQRTT